MSQSAQAITIRPYYVIDLIVQYSAQHEEMLLLRRRGGVSVGWLKSYFDSATVHLETVTTR